MIPKTVSIPRLVLAEQGPPPITVPSPRDRGVQVWLGPDGLPAGIGHTADGQHWLHLVGFASFAFGDGTPDRVTAYPLRPLAEDRLLDGYERLALPFILHLADLEVLHASAVTTFDGGVLALCGVSGMGKSTLAYALHRHGLPMWADDAVAFETQSGGIACHPLPFQPRLLPAAAEYFGTSQIGEPGRRIESLPPPAPLTLICLLQHEEDSRPSAVPPIAAQYSPAAAFQALLPHAYAFSLRNQDRNERMLGQYMDLCERVPVHAVRYPSGLQHVPDTVRHIMGLKGAA